MFALYLFSFGFSYQLVFGQNHTGILADPPPDGAGFTGLHFATLGSYGCQNRNDIKPALENLDLNLYLVSLLATAAANALIIEGVEKSPAFLRWFGAGNAGRVSNIRVNNYISIVDWLEFPTTQIDFYAQRISPDGPFTTYTILPSSLVYVCGSSTRYPCISSGFYGRSAIAVTGGQMLPHTLPPFGATVLFLCPLFFRLPDFTKLGINWLSQPQIWSIDGSSTLLHEAQHMIQITGPSHLAIDVPTHTSGGCYDIDVCAGLPDDLKIINAQNFVFFALDAYFKPRLIYPPNDNSSQSEADSLMSFGKHIIPKSIISPDLPSSSPFSPSSSSRLPSSSSSSTSSPIVSTSITSSSTSSSTTPSIPTTETISQGSTEYVGIGVIVVGGAGGGVYIAGSSTYPINEGQTETAGSKGNPTITTLSISVTLRTTMTTSSSSTSGCTSGSTSACTTASGLQFLDEDLNGLNDQQIISIMGPIDYTPTSTTSIVTSTATSTSTSATIFTTNFTTT